MNDYAAVISAINFVNSAFLLTVGLIIIIAGLLIINNLVMRFYIPMGVIKFIKSTVLDTGVQKEIKPSIENNSTQINDTTKTN